jgi:hypothetical protein
MRILNTTRDRRAGRGVPGRITASRVVPAPPAEVFAFLAEWQNHRLLTGRSIRLLALAEDPDGRVQGLIQLRGPLGLRRVAQTTVATAREPSAIGGTARVGSRTFVHVDWEMHPAARGETHVVLSAAVATAGRLDSLLLLAGGKLWIRRLFAATLALLGRHVDRARFAAPRLAPGALI